jgi:hypothetical protein
MKVAESRFVAPKRDVRLRVGIEATLYTFTQWEVFVLDHMYNEIKILVPMAARAF